MLILGRHTSESIRIHTADGIIEVLITKVDGNHVKLGFEAPDSVTILRSEIDPSAENYLPSPYRKELHRKHKIATDRGIKFFLRKIGFFSSAL